MLPHRLHEWTDADGEEWYCIAYDHSPFCRNCLNLDKDSFSVEEVSELICELAASQELLDEACQIMPDSAWEHASDRLATWEAARG